MVYLKFWFQFATELFVIIVKNIIALSEVCDMNVPEERDQRSQKSMERGVER
jgi:hypothetical protein